MIEKLTQEQIDALSAHCDEWLKIGLSTERVDRDKARAAVTKAYSCAGLKPPKDFVFLDGPTHGAIAASMLSNLSPSKNDQVGIQVCRQAGAEIEGEVVGQALDQVWGQTWDQVDNRVEFQIGGQVWRQALCQVGFYVKGQVRKAIAGSYDAGFAAYVSFFRSEFGIGEIYDGLSETVKTCGWWWPFENVCVITDRPLSIVMENKVLHNGTGPAIEYADGTKVYAFNGVTIPQDWVENRSTIDPSVILKCRNVEQRAAGCAMLGWDKIAPKLGYTVIDGDPQTDIGALVEMTLPGLPDPGRFLMAQCPRNGTICEGVPMVSDIDDKPINTAIAAQAYRDCLPADEYTHPAIRT